MTGKEMCGLSKEEFCTRAPVFVGDILWEHLVLLQQDVDREKAALKNAPSTLSEISTEPVSLPPSPPRQSQLYPVSQPVSHSASPHKTYHTLSPQRTNQYSAPSPPLAYTNLETSVPPVTIKSEYPSSEQYQYQYHPYQRLAQPYQHYSYQPTNLYEMAQPGGPYPPYHQSQVPVERWGQQTASYQVTRG